MKVEPPHALAPLSEGWVEGARECGLHHESMDVASMVGHLSGASNEHVEGLDRTITLICKGVSAAAEISLDMFTSCRLTYAPCCRCPHRGTI